jgi:hypothetical protein
MLEKRKFGYTTIGISFVKGCGNMKKNTKTGTDIEEVKERNKQSGLTYNEVKDKVLEAYIKKQMDSN